MLSNVSHNSVTQPLWRIALIAVLLAIGLSVRAQIPQTIGIGVSGSSSVRDTVVVNPDSLFAVISYLGAEGWDFRAVSLAPDFAEQVIVHGYSGPNCTGERVISQLMTIDDRSVVHYPELVPPRVSFVVPLGPMTEPHVRSLQLEAALRFRSADTDTHTVRRTSYVPEDGYLPTLDSVDEFHAQYLAYEDTLTNPPVILQPVERGIVARYFTIVYNQPEPSGSEELYVVIQSGASEQHILFLTNPNQGEGKTVQLDSWNLGDSPDVVSVVGGDSLAEGVAYRILLFYTDINRNPEAFDEVLDVGTDFHTDAGVFIQPAMGAESPDSTILVIYRLTEPADSVWMSFVADTLSLIRDSVQHSFLLTSSLRGAGEHVFTIDGDGLGTGGRNIQYNPAGFNDALRSQVVYNVTLSYGDVIGNENVAHTNRGFIWPYDSTTIAPVVESPINFARVTQTFYFQLYLPDAPLPGSVYLFLQRGIGSDPGAPHTIHLGTLGVQGRTGFYLNGSDLNSADMVTSVEGHGTPEENNRMVDGVRYILRVFYQDSRENRLAGSLPIQFVYDVSTTIPLVSSPIDGDTISYAGMQVVWDQFERGSSGSPQIVLAQTGGPEFDAGSPHTLFLTNADSAINKLVTINPTALNFSVGVDSVRGGISLVRRGVYRLSLSYRDILYNPPAEYIVSGLVFPSGSSVYVRGGSVGGDDVTPGESVQTAFVLALKTNGGGSALRSISFTVDGDATPNDLTVSNCILWASVDSVLNAGVDQSLVSLGSWFGGPMAFDSFSLPLDGSDKFIFATLAFPPSADAGHRVRLLVASPQDIDCGGDPVIAEHWPIGTPDVALPVSFTSFYTEQDTAFGSLRVFWDVASELNNEGFNLYRRADVDTTWVLAGSYTEYAQLVGRNTAATGWRYGFVDQGLTAGRLYYYRVEAIATGGHRIVYDTEAQGIPRVPPNMFALAAAYPNPFNQDVTLKYVVPYTATIELTIYDLTGRRIRELVKALQPPSEYTAGWDSRDDSGRLVPSGMYFYRLRAGGIFDETKKLLLLR